MDFKKTQTLISISDYSSDKEKKQIEEIFSPFNPKVEKTYITKSLEQQLLQILIDLSQIDIKDILYGGIIYDFLKKAIKSLYQEIKTKKPVLKLKYRDKIIYYSQEDNLYWTDIKDKKKVNIREDNYGSKYLIDVFKIIDEEFKNVD